ncbi:hypothetical protein ACFQZ4_00965 [Catellatospora coxensis]
MATTVTVKATDSQRWTWRIHLFQFMATSERNGPRPVVVFGRPTLCAAAPPALLES